MAEDAQGRPQLRQGGLPNLDCPGFEERCRQIAAHLHHLRMPLTHIKAVVSTLQATDLEWDEASRRELLRELDCAADRLTRLVRELLDDLLQHSSAQQPSRDCLAITGPRAGETVSCPTKAEWPTDRHARGGPSRMWPSPACPPASNRLLAAVPTDELARLRPFLTLVAFEREQLVTSATESGRSVYFPLSGLTSLVVSMADGHTIEVAGVGPEGFIGVSDFLVGNTDPYDAICQVQTEVLAVSADVLRRLWADMPELRRLMRRYTLALLHETARTAACSGLHTVEQRLARWLLLSRYRLQADDLRLTHEVLAGLLGTTRPFLTGTLQTLQRESLVRFSRGHLYVLDPCGLEQRACEDYQLTIAEYEHPR